MSVSEVFFTPVFSPNIMKCNIKLGGESKRNTINEKAPRISKLINYIS